MPQVELPRNLATPSSARGTSAATTSKTFIRVDFKERSILEYALAKGKPGDPVSVFSAMDEFGYQREWHMSTGDKKGPLIDAIIQKKKPKLFLEIGGYVGYSAIRFCHQQLQALGEGASSDALYVSIEIDPLFAVISTKIIEHAGLQDHVKVLVGSLTSSAEKVKAAVAARTGGNPSHVVPFDVIFIDHWKDRYVSDFLLLEELGFIGSSTTVIADNVIMPGAPEYLKLVMEEKADEYDNQLLESTFEYSGEADGILVSVRKGNPAA